MKTDSEKPQFVSRLEIVEEDGARAKARQRMTRFGPQSDYSESGGEAAS